MCDLLHKVIKDTAASAIPSWILVLREANCHAGRTFKQIYVESHKKRDWGTNFLAMWVCQLESRFLSPSQAGWLQTQLTSWLQSHESFWVRTTQLIHLQKLCEIINIYCYFKPLCLRIIFHVAIDNKYITDMLIINCVYSVAKSCPTLCNPVDCGTLGLPAPHHLPELAQVHVYWIGDAI